ncbi:MAG: polymerase sigma-70 factor, subfamily [Chloroflexi bacterium]|nr:polymerase sigma-70 factor, subfamily [Chloroflexota bacterium]
MYAILELYYLVMKSKSFYWSRSIQASTGDQASTGALMADDLYLITRAKRFDSQALAEIYDRFSPGIYRYALRLLGDQEMARECMAETFQRFLAALQRGAGPNDYLQAYLYRIAHNWITDTYRRRTPPMLPLDPELRSDPGEEPHRLVDEELERKQVRAALALLTPEQRQVITLKYLEDWQNDEIARALDKPVSAIKSLQHRAIGALRRILIQSGEENQ